MDNQTENRSVKRLATRFQNLFLGSLLLLTLSLAFSACNGNTPSSNPSEGSSDNGQIVMPPDIPTPPKRVDVTDPNSPQMRLVYEDIIQLEASILKSRYEQDKNNEKSDFERQQRSMPQQLALVHAVQEAIKKGALTPPPYQKGQPVYFQPDQAVSYGDFYAWALGFAQPGQNHPMDMNTNTENSNEPDAGTNNDIGADDQGLNLGLGMPLMDGEAGGHPLLNASLITRETLCLLYVKIRHLEEKADTLSEDAIAQSNPGKSAMYNLSAFSDVSVISPWAKKYVALAYQENLPETAFGLKSTALVNGKGLEPQKSVTRAEALVFLYQYFSTHSP